VDQKSRIREKLMAVYQRLSPLEQALMQLCSVIYQPTDVATLLKGFQQTGLIFPDGNPISAAQLESHIDRLQSLKLLNKRLQCHEAIVEVCSRHALVTPIASELEQVLEPRGETRVLPAQRILKKKSPKPSKAPSTAAISPPLSNRYQLMVRAIQEETPLGRWYGAGSLTLYCQRLMRNLRIGLYMQDKELLNKSYEGIYTHCSAMYCQVEPLSGICNNPFDLAWFRTLPVEFQVNFLAEIFYHSKFSLEADHEALAYALNPQFLDAISAERHPVFYVRLITRLLLAGRLQEAEKLLTKASGAVLLFGLRGWLLFLKEQDDAAIASFEADLKALRRHLRNRNAYFSGVEGLFFLLALLKSEGASELMKAGTLLDAAIAKHGDGSLLALSFAALKAVVRSLNCEARSARDAQADSAHSGTGLNTFFRILASYWSDSRLAQEDIDTLSDLFIKSREAGLNWLAMECAELLCRAEENTPVRRNAIEKIRQETGMQSFVAGIRVEEPWRKSIRALADLTTGAQEGAAKPADARLIWLLDYSHGVLSVQPIEQKLTARGVWTKGRAVALSRLFGGKRPECLSSQDQAICAAIERVGRTYYNTRYYFNTSRLLPALVGHPLLFLEKSPGVSVEVLKGEPEVLVTRADTDILIRFSMEPPESHVVLVQETPSRFKVVELSNHHLRIAGILGEKGLKVPASAAQEVMDAVATISSQVTVHSAISGISRNIEEIAADPTPRMHVMPSGPGFRFELFVQPFGAAGPYLKPGSGMENIIAEIDGKLRHTRRDLKCEEEGAEVLETACPTLAVTEENERQWQLDDLQSCLQVLLELKALQDSGAVILAWPEGEKLKVSRELSFDRLHLRIRSKTDWFEIGGELQVDDHLVLDMRRLLELIDADSTRFLPLGQGQFVALTRELRKRLEDLADYSERHGNELRLHPLAAVAIEDFTEQVPRVDADQGWKARLAGMRSALQLKPALPSTLKAELRDYQVEGYQWLARLAHLGLGGCLADDMGLGKTLQALALILERAPGGPSLVVAPTSVCMNWVTEANRFAPTLNMVNFGGNNREQMVKNLGGMDVLVVSYGLLYQEAELMASLEWRTIILDEAQAIKNLAAKRSQAAMHLRGSMRLITTGTPIENHLGELWTLFNFINPGLLGSQDRFNTRYAFPIERNSNREARKRLKKLIQPFILRRTKAQVLEELPPRTEVVLQVEMSPEEAAFYEALRRQALERLERDDSPVGQKHLKILAEIMKLRQACCHPRLVLPKSDIAGSKLELFGEVVSELLENRHKALVFSQFVGHLKLLREFLEARNLDYRYLDGSTPPRERKREVDAFQAGWGDLFLISLKAGGLGLNLTAADYVLHMDPWWNPAVEDQASDRAHRIGQQRPVTVYRLVTRNTIEEKIVKLHQEKRDLASSLLDGSDMVGKMSAEELLKLIREQ
jgi:SNF2 family DNA or RNA helicase